MTRTRYSLLLMMLLFSGCATSARYVVREADWGVVAVPAPTTWPVNHVDRAKQLMSDHFPDGYVVDREEEVIVGQTTSTNSHIHEHGNGGHEQQVTTTRDQSEWRITYRRAEPRR